MQHQASVTWQSQSSVSLVGYDITVSIKCQYSERWQSQASVSLVSHDMTVSSRCLYRDSWDMTISSKHQNSITNLTRDLWQSLNTVSMVVGDNAGIQFKHAAYGVENLCCASCMARYASLFHHLMYQGQQLHAAFTGEKLNLYYTLDKER